MVCTFHNLTSGLNVLAWCSQPVSDTERIELNAAKPKHFPKG